MKAVVMSRAGGRDVLEVVDQPTPRPGAGQVLVDVTFAGVNFVDVGVRQGTSWKEDPNPKTLGVEGAGRVAQLGDGVTGLSVGQRVAWVYARGSYASQLVLPAVSVIPLPAAIDERTAAAVMMQGITASHFATDFYKVQPGDYAFVHAAAGGLGMLLTQVIKLRGGQVIGRVSSVDKVSVAKEVGVDHVIVDAEGRFVEETLSLTSGEGVHVVYDGSGPVTFKGSIDILRRSGTFCWYGTVLGGPGPIDLLTLPRSIKLGFAVFMDHIATPAMLQQRAAQLFDWIASGQLTVRIGGEFPLVKAAQAQAAIESRKTTGKLLLVP